MSKLSQMRVSTKMMGNLKAESIPLLPQVHSVCVCTYMYMHISMHMCSTCIYRMADNFRGVLILVIFVIDLAVTKISTHEN